MNPNEDMDSGSPRPLGGEGVQSFLDSISNPRLKQVLYELYSSLGGMPRSPEDNRPEWALNAWKEFWRSLGLAQVAVEESSEATGYRVGVLSHIPPDALQASPDIFKMF